MLAALPLDRAPVRSTPARGLPRARRAAAAVERQDRGRRPVLSRRRQERAGLARLCLLPPGSRRPAQRRGGACRQEAERPRRIHAEPSDQPREAAMNEDVFNGSLRRFLEKGRHHLAARDREGGARRRRIRPPEGSRETARENRADRRRRQPVPRDLRRDRAGVGDLPWTMGNMGVAFPAIRAAESGQ